MRKLLLVTVLVVFCGITFGVGAQTQSARRPADWLTDGGDVQRTGWQRNETVLTTNNVKDLKILWKLQLDNAPREMHSLLPPLIVGEIPTSGGPKEIAIVAGSSDNIYAIDVKAGQILWKKHFDYPPAKTSRRIGDTLCPGGQTATPVIGPADASGRRTIYALDGSGALRQLNVADGREIAPPVHFTWRDGKAYALNLVNNVLYTTTAQGCAGNPNQVWALDLNNVEQVKTFNPGSGGLWGRTGAAVGADGTVYAPTGDGVYDPENQVYGNGLIGVRLEGNQLKLKDYFIPSNWAWLRKRDLDMNVTPAIFNYKGRELMVVSSKECRLWLLDTKSLGGTDHQTPLYRTPLLCNEEVDFAAAGIWGSMATWEDAQGTRWILTPIWGPPHSEFRVPASHGPVTHGAIVALKLEEKSGQLVLTPAWMSRDMDLAEPPVIANGVIYTFGNGEDATQATAEGGLDSSAPRRIPLSKHAVLYALDAQTGRELYSSGTQITSFNHFSGVSVANGRVYIGTFDGMFYCFGLEGGAAPQAAQTTPYVPKQTDRPEVIAGDEPGFQPIFDGKTLSGWEGNATYWRAENGAIVGEIVPSTVIKSNTFIIWRGGTPGDFELKLDYRITEGGNSGINYRSVVVPDPVTPANKFAMRGYQYDLDGRHRYDGNNYEEKGRLFLAVRGQVSHVVGGRPPVVLSSFAQESELAAVATSDWNATHIIARDNIATHMLNGRLMSITIDDDAPNRRLDGSIGMQVHVGPPMKVEYRNIRLKRW
jgi:outer membrane protein assembly factor BamB